MGSGELIAAFEEVESGAKADRPALDAALRECRIRRATLVIAKLDRLARSVAFVSKLQEDGVDFVAADMPHANTFTIQIIAATAEFERKLISERTVAALKAAKARGVVLGGRRPGHRIEDHSGVGRQRSAIVRSQRARERVADCGQIIESIRAEGISSLRGIAAVLNSRGIPAARGGSWSAGQVRRIVLPMGASS